MAFLLGTDEAGYGPNLGPLVVACAVWETPDDLAPEDLYDALRDVVGRTPRETAGRGALLTIADSKVLHKSKGSLEPLERVVLTMLHTLNRESSSWRTLWETLSPEGLPWRAGDLPWYAEYDEPLPSDADAAFVTETAERFLEAFDATGARLVDLRARAVFPAEFNREVDARGTKGGLLSHTTLALAAAACEGLPDGRIQILCDKHGGRNQYRPFLEEHFPDWLIEIAGESRAVSCYRFGPTHRRHEIRFEVGGESVLATALASITAKYLREQAMAAFNAYWRKLAPDVRPTAGYPQDAKRFLTDIAEVEPSAGVDREAFWRKR